MDIVVGFEFKLGAVIIPVLVMVPLDVIFLAFKSPLALIFPTTSSFSPGSLVPIPTLSVL